MKKIRIRVLSLLMAILTAFMLVPVTASAEETVSDLRATITLPAAGETPVFTGTSGDSTKYYVNDVIFEDENNNPLGSSDKFEMGKTYYVYVHFKPNDGYALDPNGTAKINNRSAVRWAIYGDNSLLYQIEYTVPEEVHNYITDVHIGFDFRSVQVRTDLTGRQVSSALKKALTGVNEGVHFDQSCTYLVRRLSDSGGTYYEPMVNSDELIDPSDTFFYRINLEDDDDHEWDPDNLPYVTIDASPMSEIAFVQWYDDDRSSVDVFVSVDVTNSNYVCDLDVTPKHQKIKKGSSYQFNAEVEGSVSAVNWSLSDKNSSNTYVTDSGMVYIGTDETAEEITLTATSVFNTRISEKVYIEVTNEDVYIMSVKITPKTASVKCGNEIDLVAEVVGTDDHTLEWEIFGNNSYLTMLNTASTPHVYLQIAEEETASSVTVRATSVKDPSKYDEAVITVIPPDLIHEASVTFDMKAVTINETVTGKDVSSQLKTALEKASTSDNIHIDLNCSYLVKKEGSSFTKLENSTDKLNKTDEYYLLINLEENAGFQFDKDMLPSVELNGKPATVTDWYSGEHSSVNIYLRVFVDRLKAPSLSAQNVYGSGIKLSWNSVENATVYAVYRKNGSEFIVIHMTPNLSFTDTIMKGGEKHTYYVEALNTSTGNISEPSNEASMTYNPFKDVKTSESYFKHLMWAYNNEVIKGTTATTFNPKGNCKRCDLAVMLYRMYGKPSISGMNNPFSDVKSSDYFYSAVVWASNKGYIKGLSGTTKFNPQGTITRQDMVVILWRINGSKVVDIENPFTDVKEGHYAYKAIMWAYDKKITSGTSATTFAPTANCQRYQLAVFLHKFNDIEHVIS
ncbi:MAG: S-layer homology domain-containing protein [Clostridia bacterium]|nr:S-layer homology domain-containing protein [Clostridia bacterium]